MYFLVEMEFRHVGQAGLEFLASGDPPALASQSAWATGENLHAQLTFILLNVTFLFFDSEMHSYGSKIKLM